MYCIDTNYLQSSILKAQEEDLYLQQDEIAAAVRVTLTASFTEFLLNIAGVLNKNRRYLILSLHFLYSISYLSHVQASSLDF